MANAVHDTKYYTVGKGVLMFKPYGETGVIDLGNCEKGSVALETETLENFSSRQDLGSRDQYLITQIKGNISVTMNSITVENMALWLMSDGATETTQVVGTTGAIDFASILMGRWYNLGFFGVTSVKVMDSENIVTYVEGTDYILNKAAGLIQFIGATLVDTDEIHCTEIVNTEVIYNTIEAGQKANLRGHLYFYSDAPLGQVADFEAFGVLVPQGSLESIGKEFQKLEVKFECLKESGNDYFIKFTERGNVQI